MIDEIAYRKKFLGYKFQSVVYLISRENKVLYLHKIKFTEPTHNKLVGFGGNFESGENAFSCSIRELKEELGLVKGDYSDLILQGVLVREDFKRVIFVLKAELYKFVEDGGEVKNEGLAVYRNLNFHQNLENLECFMGDDLQFLDILFFSNEFFEVVVPKK